MAFEYDEKVFPSCLPKLCLPLTMQKMKAVKYGEPPSWVRKLKKPDKLRAVTLLSFPMILNLRLIS